MLDNFLTDEMNAGDNRNVVPLKYSENTTDGVSKQLKHLKENRTKKDKYTQNQLKCLGQLSRRKIGIFNIHYIWEAKWTGKSEPHR